MQISGKEDLYFQSASFGELSIIEMLTSIKDFLEEDPNKQYRLVIGTDSHEKSTSLTGPKQINIVTAVVIYRVGSGGRYFWRRKFNDNIYTLRDKIYAETLVSLDFAKIFVPLLQKHLNGNYPRYDLEIHVDVGEHGASREMIKEVVGMVTGYGFVAKTKPESFAASYVADKHT